MPTAIESTVTCSGTTTVQPKDWYMKGWSTDKPKRICIDLDGVVVQYDFPALVRNSFGVDLSKSTIYAYDLADVLGVSPKTIDLMFHNVVYGEPKFTFGAIDTLREWKSKGYELIIFSNRVKYMGELGLAKWLTDYQIPFSDIDGGQGEYDVHIDDSPGKLMATNSKVKLLYNQPWNERCLNITGSLQRVYSWDEIRKKVL